ncbi:MAG: PadR family transcriptional regulator [Candidatus Bathyarchaeota archaeon]|nr:PadR family transcriptional regulator [Candidatus Bathyarchaeota archaeon]
MNGGDSTISGYWDRSFIVGSAKLLVLSVLGRGPLHGYGVLKEISDRSGGCCTITSGTIYPVLRELEKEKLITSTKGVASGRARVVYELTDAGRRVLDEGLSKWETHQQGARKILGKES